MNNVLFVTEKWCGSNPNYGFANYFDNLFSTFSETMFDHKLHTLHFDEAYLLYGRHIDQVLIPYCQRFSIPTIIFACGGHSPMHPSLEMIKSLKKIGIFICFIWYDNNPTELDFRMQMKEVIDLNIIIDYPRSAYHDQYKLEHAQKDLYLWTPESLFYFYPDEQTVDVSFIGSSRYADRNTYLTNLASSLPYMIMEGGQREKGLSFSYYASLIRRSKININFSKNPQIGGYDQLKGRVLETIASRSLLMEEKNQSTSDFFIPGVDYVEFDGLDDLKEKIKYYLEHEDLRREIALSGYNKFMDKYTAKHFWKAVFERIQS